MLKVGPAGPLHKLDEDPEKKGTTYVCREDPSPDGVVSTELAVVKRRWEKREHLYVLGSAQRRESKLNTTVQHAPRVPQQRHLHNLIRTELHPEQSQDRVKDLCSVNQRKARENVKRCQGSDAACPAQISK